MTISDRQIDQAYSDLKAVSGGVRLDYFGLLFLEREHDLPRDRARNQVAFGGNDYGIDGFHFDRERRNLYLYQFKYSNDHSLFKTTYKRLIDVGVERVFSSPNRDDKKNEMLLQLRSCLHENRSAIDQVCFRFVFTGDPQDAERSIVLENYREQLENKKYLAELFFRPREVGFLVEYRSAEGRVGSVHTVRQSSSFAIHLDSPAKKIGPGNEVMHVGFVSISELVRIYGAMGPRFLDRNIRFGLKETEVVNRAISSALKSIVLDRATEPDCFAFNHNGITLYAEQLFEEAGEYTVTAPSLLNGAQSIVTANAFMQKCQALQSSEGWRARFDAIQVMCRIITNASPNFVTTVTINNNRQNPVEPWNLRANDEIQLELQDKFRNDVKVYYERQENAFDQLSTEDLEEYGILEDSKAIQMLKLTQTFLLTDGSVSRLSEMRSVFEDDKVYNHVFRQARLKADSRHILLCYKVQFRLRRVANEIEQKGQNKYAFVHRARNLIWALVAQGLLNSPKLEDLSEEYGTSMTLPAAYSDLVSEIATARVRPLLSELLSLAIYKDKVAEGNYSFLRTDAAFERCMEAAYSKWRWVHKKLS